jgi:hypothetical protein
MCVVLWYCPSMEKLWHMYLYIHVVFVNEDRYCVEFSISDVPFLECVAIWSRAGIEIKRMDSISLVGSGSQSQASS